MGKSPAKWIKSVLFGKKGSRSNTPNGRHASKATLEKETWVTAKEPTTDFPVDPPSVSEPITSTAHVKEESLDVEEESADDIPCDDGGMLPKNRDAEMHDITASEVLDDPERIRQEQAAIKAQAAFRGYLARRAFWALKGIIRLQALVRGHLVRRQAIATLRCLQGIIKFQAVVRSRKVKLSDAGLEAHKKFKRPLDGTVLGSAEVSTSIQRVKLSENVFVSKLLRSSTTVIPLRLPYIQEEPNSAWSWLERWTSSRLCESVPQPKKVNGSKSQLRQDQGRSKRTIRRTSPGNVDNGMPHSASETEKPKRILRKVVSHPTDPIQEQPQNELEKVKRSLRKVSNSLVDSTDPLEVESEKPKRIQRKESNPQVSDIPDKITCDSAEKMTKNIMVETKSSPRKVLSSPPPDIPDITTFDSAETTEENFTMASEEADIITSNPLVAKEPVNGLHKDPPLELQPSETITKDESTRETNVDEISKDSPTNHDNQKTSQRRSSFTVKEDNPENGLQNSPTLPSYMAATQSAKAKLRGQGSPKVGQDVAEKNGFTRRHSLPSSTNGKLNSVSPRPQRLVQTNGKGGPKNDKSLLSSRDSSEKVVQAGWRR